MSKAPKGKHAHGEAFCLMHYECVGERNKMPSCGHRETFWNSRDGVTPFMMACPSCGRNMQHVHWQYDTYAPDHKPHYGQGVWRDGTPDEAEHIMRKRLERYPEGHLTPEYVEKLIATVRNPDDPGNTEFRRGWPMFERHGLK